MRIGESEGIVAGLEPFIDTIVVCTFTALIILSTGVWNRAPDETLDVLPAVSASAAGWHFEDSHMAGDDWRDGERTNVTGASTSTGWKGPSSAAMAATS